MMSIKRELLKNTETNNQEVQFVIMVPVYKVENFIKDCINSVLEQTYQNFKLILVNDGSPDHSGEICDEYALKDSRVTVIHQRNMGLIAARQAAVRYARQLSDLKEKTYIVYLDSDDSLKNYALEKIQQTICEYNCDMVIYGSDKVSEGKIVYEYDKKNGFEGMVEDKRELYRRVFNNSEYNQLCRKAVLIDLLPDTDYRQYYNIFHAEDLLQSIAFYKACKRVYFMNESLYNYTINPASITRTVSEKNFEVNFTVLEMVGEFLKAEAVFTEDDWIQYTSYSIRIILSKIRTILSLSITDNKRKQYFSEIRNSEYYRKYIHNQNYNKEALGKIKSVSFIFFDTKCDWPLLVGGKLYRGIMKWRK